MGGVHRDATLVLSPDEAAAADAQARALQSVTARLFGTSKLGRYVLRERLGAGGLGVVYVAHDPELDRPVAIKLLKTRALAAGIDVARLRREGAALAQLAHPNVVAVYDVGEYDGDEAVDGDVPRHGAFIVMELVRGEPLDQWMETKRSEAEILDVYLQAGRGLAAAHAAGITHRDFKLANVIVGEDGRVKVLDFGLARVHDADATEPASGDGSAPELPRALLDTPLTQTGLVMGTPAYMAPEQHTGHAADARSDQYSFCLALAEALHGARILTERDYEALATAKRSVTKLPQVQAIVSPARRVLTRGLAETPEDRWPTMDALLQALSNVRGRRRGWAWLGVTVAAAGAVGLVVGRAPTPKPTEAPASVASPDAAAGPATVEEKSPAVEPFLAAARLVKAGRDDDALRDFAARTRAYAEPRGDLQLSSWGWYWEAASWDVVQNAARVIPLYANAYFQAEASGESFVAADSAYHLAYAFSVLGDVESLQWERYALAQLDRGDIPAGKRAGILGNLGLVHVAANRMPEGAVLFRAAIEELEAEGDPMSPSLEWPMSNLASVLTIMGEYEEAGRWADRALALRMELRGVSSPEVAVSHMTRGMMLLDRGYPIEALGELEQAHTIMAAAAGEQPHEQVSNTLTELSRATAALGRVDEAIDLQREALSILERLDSQYQLPFVKGSLQLARLYRDSDRLDDARRTYAAIVALEDLDPVSVQMQHEAQTELSALRVG